MPSLSSILEHVIAARYLKKTKRECGTGFCKNKGPGKTSMFARGQQNALLPLVREN